MEHAASTTTEPVRGVATLASALLLLTAGCTDGYVDGSPDGESDTAPDGVTDVGVDSGDTWNDNPKDTVADTTDETGDVDDDTMNPNTCTPEGDGRIQRSEVPLRAGLQATFRVTTDVQVDTSGTTDGETRVWDFSGDYPGDHPEAVEFRSVDGTWFAEEFPEADYATSLADDSDELGVFKSTDEALLLLGVVSPQDGVRTTEIAYEPPVKVLDFPLEPGKTWKTETQASGTHKVWSPFAPITYEETYQNKVDAQGRVETPYGRFQALRIETVMERTSAATAVPLETLRTFSFVAECFGTIATVRSESDESKKEFEQAASLRRLSK